MSRPRGIRYSTSLLGDVSEGETVTFELGTEVTVEIPDTMPLSIFTVGEEIDRCGRGNHPDNQYESINHNSTETTRHLVRFC